MAVEPTSCPTLTKGEFRYDFGDVAGFTPLMTMYTLGHDFMPSGIHAGGLRYHGDSPLVSQLYHDKIIEARAYPADKGVRGSGPVLRDRSDHSGAGKQPRSAGGHRRGDSSQKRKASSGTILFNLSGHGYLDLQAYADYKDGKLFDHEHPEEDIKKALEKLPKI